jgi:hypothetical protein
VTAAWIGTTPKIRDSASLLAAMRSLMKSTTLAPLTSEHSSRVELVVPLWTASILPWIR